MELYKDPSDIVPSMKAFEAGVLRPIFSQHSNLPCARSKEKDLSSMRAIFILSGSEVKKNSRGDRVNLVDVVPTISHIIGINPPRQCEGRIVRECLK